MCERNHKFVRDFVTEGCGVMQPGVPPNSDVVTAACALVLRTWALLIVLIVYFNQTPKVWEFQFYDCVNERAPLCVVSYKARSPELIVLRQLYEEQGKRGEESRITVPCIRD